MTQPVTQPVTPPVTQPVTQPASRRRRVTGAGLPGELHTRRKVRSLLQGEYASIHVGRSMDFNDLRAYVRGDDVRDLDWKASARTGHLLVRRYVATRKHTVLLALPTGSSMRAACGDGTAKDELALQVAGLLGWLALRHGDLVGVVAGDAEGHRVHRPHGSEQRLEHALGRVHADYRASSAATDPAALLAYVIRTIRRRTVLVLLCDAHEVDDRLAAALRRAAAQHDVLVVTLGDIDPTRPWPSGCVDVDSDQALPAWVCEDPALAADYGTLLAHDAESLQSRLDGLGIAHEHVRAPAAAAPALAKLLRRHRRVTG